MYAASLLTIFAPCNQAMKQVPDMFDEDFMLTFTNNKDKLKEVSMSLPLSCSPETATPFHSKGRRQRDPCAPFLTAVNCSHVR